MPPTPDLAALVWRKSSHSTAQGNECVEIAGVGGYAAVRDSKDPRGPRFVLGASAWNAFISQVKTGLHDRVERAR
ncbi:DUF397 domain-containing protein [Spirillospora sp. NPDC029432]|uniref:DUF397 domain-containing protein n=1 Tax=Spirillospora sp. NPDC029432 TaxID=3154599 RepID=UPI00345189D6